jgi:hypothetical protein
MGLVASSSAHCAHPPVHLTMSAWDGCSNVVNSGGGGASINNNNYSGGGGGVSIKCVSASW